MRPLYFCANCKQYHATCNKTMSKSSSIKYLRFADLFNQVPTPHPQNFTVSSPRRLEDSRLVYKEDSEIVNSNLSVKKSLYNNKGVKKSNQDSRMTIEGRSFSQYKCTPHKLQLPYNKSQPKQKNSMTNSRLNTSLGVKNQHSIERKQLYEKGTITKKQIPSSSSKLKGVNKGPYYVGVNLKISDDLMKHRVTEQSTFIEKTNKKQRSNKSLLNLIDSSTPMEKNSYIYGDNYRKILVSQKKTSQFKYGKLIESREQVFGQQKKSQTILQNPVNRSLQSNTQKSTIKQTPRQIKQEIQQYENRLNQLKSRLKNGLKSSNQKQIKPTHNHSAITIHISNEINNQSSQHSDYQPQSFKKPAKITDGKNQGNFLQVHAHKQLLAKQGIKQCKYFDNRCLGFNFRDQGQICFIKDMHDLK